MNKATFIPFNRWCSISAKTKMLPYLRDILSQTAQNQKIRDPIKQYSVSSVRVFILLLNISHLSNSKSPIQLPCFQIVSSLRSHYDTKQYNLEVRSGGFSCHAVKKNLLVQPTCYNISWGSDKAAPLVPKPDSQNSPLFYGTVWCLSPVKTRRKKT